MYEEALQYFDNAIDLDPNYTNAVEAKAFVLIKIGRTDEAKAMLLNYGFDDEHLDYLLSLFGIN